MSGLKQYKKDFGYSYTFGVYPTLELLKYQPRTVLNVFVSPSGLQNTGVAEIRKICEDRQIQCEVSAGAVEKLTKTENSYAAGVFRKYESSLDANANHVVLVQPEDKGNLGSICRSMLAFDVTNLAIIKPAVDIFDPKVVRASMGAIFRMSFQYFSTFDEYMSVFHRNYYPFLTEATTLLSGITFAPPYSLIFGSESSGLSRKYQNLGTPVKIPQSDMVDSLNLSLSVGISLYEASKKK
ncbi:MAG: TrmH family RNA methyltransferase [Candidatus Levybacteria bacterium]|nr:TrmH family RNA methyltransferase [Candidatus Levybacteria bacterium]